MCGITYYKKYPKKRHKFFSKHAKVSQLYPCMEQLLFIQAHLSNRGMLGLLACISLLDSLRGLPAWFLARATDFKATLASRHSEQFYVVARIYVCCSSSKGQKMVQASFNAFRLLARWWWRLLGVLFCLPSTLFGGIPLCPFPAAAPLTVLRLLFWEESPCEFNQ